MAYLVVRKVKGHHYLYRQESYREGGKVRTRTVEYLGAVDPATAQVVQNTRRRLTKADMRALTQSVKAAVAAEILTDAPRAPPAGSGGQTAPDSTNAPQSGSETVREMTVNGQSVTVNLATGEILSPFELPPQTATPEPNPVVITEDVITTDSETSASTEPLRPFHRALHLPDDLERYGVSRAALAAAHRRFGKRLEAMHINPATMPDIRLAYGHPDRFKRHRDGSYSVQISRQPANAAHPVHKAKLWTHYRQALAHGMLDAMQYAQPERFAALEAQLDHSQRETKRLLFAHIAALPSTADRLRLSLQLYFWNRLPAAQTGRASPQAYGLADFSTLGDWRNEAAFILAEEHKHGWRTLEEKTRKSRAALKAAITKRRNLLEHGGFFQKVSRKLSGKEHRTLREIMEREKRLAANARLLERLRILRMSLNEL